jgi:hypothetical protein
LIRARQSLAAGLGLLLLVHPALALRASAPPVAEDGPSGISSSAHGLPDAPLPEAAGLTITILDGEGALNNIRQRTAREPIVQVEDQNHKPVAGALVLFAINDGSGGAGATVNGLASFSVQTGADGRAQLRGLKPNNVSGEFTITVTASVGSLVATAIIHQRNGGGAGDTQNQTASQPGQVLHAKPNWLLRGSLLGGAAVGGILIGVILTHTSNGGQITAGTPGVGAP